MLFDLISCCSGTCFPTLCNFTGHYNRRHNGLLLLCRSHASFSCFSSSPYRQALEIREKTFGKSHLSVATVLHNLAVVLCLQVYCRTIKTPMIQCEFSLQGSYTWKVLEFYCGFLQDLKVLEKGCWF